MDHSSESLQAYHAALANRPDLNNRVGGADPAVVGRLSLASLRQCGLPQDKPITICDYGCGIGRVAAHVAHAAAPGSRLIGVDIMPEFVGFCSDNVHAPGVASQFHLLEATNEHYARTAERGHRDTPVIPAVELVTMLKESTDFLYSISVFTHLAPSMADEALRVIAAILKPGGIATLTFFLYDAEVEWRRKKGRARGEFDLDRGYWEDNTFYGNRGDRLAFVAYRPDAVLGMAQAHGLSLRSCFAGTWRGTGIITHALQDFVVFEKTK